MSLLDYQKKRNFNDSSEPSGDNGHKLNKARSIFVVQKHAASRLHYDFRLEVNGVLKSWAVPKGPSLNPREKRLAMMVEDHPYNYRNFEGNIPEGNYGAGEVIVWDKGFYTLTNTKGKEAREETVLDNIKKGKIIFMLRGKKLRGQFSLVKMNSDEKNSWLLIKSRDKYASKIDNFSDISVLSDRKLG
jgi:bifunctional non-homologous end joining protein LigD